MHDTDLYLPNLGQWLLVRIESKVEGISLRVDEKVQALIFVTLGTSLSICSLKTWYSRMIFPAGNQSTSQADLSPEEVTRQLLQNLCSGFTGKMERKIADLGYEYTEFYTSYCLRWDLKANTYIVSLAVNRVTDVTKHVQFVRDTQTTWTWRKISRCKGKYGWRLFFITD